MWEDYFLINEEVIYVQTNTKYSTTNNGNYVATNCIFENQLSGCFHLYMKDSRVLLQLSIFRDCTNTSNGGSIYINQKDCNYGDIILSKICAIRCFFNSDVLTYKTGVFAYRACSTAAGSRNEMSFMTFIDCSPPIILTNARAACTSYALYGNQVDENNNETRSSTNKHCGSYFSGGLSAKCNRIIVTSSTALEGCFLANILVVLHATHYVVCNNTDYESSEGILISTANCFLRECVFLNNIGGKVFLQGQNAGSITASSCIYDGARANTQATINTKSLTIVAFPFYATAECFALNKINKDPACSFGERKHIFCCLFLILFF